MSDERPYPPSDVKLAKLRLAGIVPRSRDVQAFAVCLGAMIGCWLSGRYLLEALPARFHVPEGGFDSSELWMLLPTLVKGSALFIVPLFVVVAIVGGLQTRFLFQLELFQFSIGRMFRLWNNLISNSKQRLVLSVLSMAKVLGWSWLCVTLGSVLLPGLLSQWDDLPSAWTGGMREVRIVLFATLGYLFFFAVLSRVVVVLVFRQTHRMSRSELEAEYRETEPSQDIKAARRGFWSSGR